MPYVSTRVGRRTRVGGGSVFWFFYAMFAMPLWLMWQMLRGAILLVAWIVREIDAGQQRKRVAAAAAPAASIADQTPHLEDAVPPLRQRLRDPDARGRAIAAGLVLAVLTALLVAAIVSGARWR